MKRPGYKAVLCFLDKKKKCLFSVNIETFRGIGEIIKCLIKMLIVHIYFKTLF